MIFYITENILKKSNIIFNQNEINIAVCCVIIIKGWNIEQIPHDTYYYEYAINVFPTLLIKLL